MSTHSLVRVKGDDVYRESSTALDAGSASQSTVTTAINKNVEGMNVLHFFGGHFYKWES